MAKKIAYSYVPDRGWTGRGFSIPHAPVPQEEVRLTLAPRGREPFDVPILRVEFRLDPVRGEVRLHPEGEG